MPVGAEQGCYSTGLEDTADDFRIPVFVRMLFIADLTCSRKFNERYRANHSP
jgi:hypothetical protein